MGWFVNHCLIIILYGYIYNVKILTHAMGVFIVTFYKRTYRRALQKRSPMTQAAATL